MTNKTLSRLIFLVAFALLILFGRNVWGRYHMQQPNEYQKAITEIKPAEIVRVELNQNSQVLVLTKQDTTWKLASKSADNAKVNELIGALLPKLSPQLISENNDKFEELEITPEIAKSVKLISQKGEKQFAIGKNIDSVTAVRIQDIDKVFGLESVPNLSIQANDWIDKTVMDIDSSNIKQLLFAGKESYILSQIGDRQWVFEGSQDKVNNDGVTTYAYKFNPFKADGLADEEQKKNFDLSSTGFSVSITDQSDTKTELMFKLIKDQFVIKRSFDNEYFTLDKTTGESFEKAKLGFSAS
jgi:hypothetical protein